MSLPTEQHHFVLKPDGKIGWIEKMPVEPEIPFNLMYSSKREDYLDALQSAIDSAVEVSGEVERLIERIKWNIYCENAGFRQPKGFNEIVDTINLEPNKPYSLLCWVEKKNQVQITFNDNLEWCDHPDEYDFKISKNPKRTVALVTFSKPEENNNDIRGEKGTQEEKIIERMFNAQFGGRANCDFIESHIKEYFDRWPSYKSKLNHLEWYHLFLDVIEKYDEFLTRKEK